MSSTRQDNKRYNNENLLGIILKTLRNCENVGYKGFYKFDYVNAKKLNFLIKKSKYFRLSLIYLSSRSPINFRRILGIKRELNDKSIALFVSTYLNLYQITNNEEFYNKGVHLVHILMSRSKQGFSGSCWGYNYPLEGLLSSIPKNKPNIVATYFAGCALLKFHEIVGSKAYLNKCEGIYDFIANDLKITLETGSEKCYSYSPFDEDKIINSNAMIASLLARLYSITNKEKYKSEADKIVQFIVNKQTDYGAWYYMYPEEDSHLKHDNYHTGYVLDSLYDYIIFCNEYRLMEYYKKGLDFYRSNLFLDTGAPKFQSNKVYPMDIHGAAQGIITFTRSPFPNDFNFAKKIGDWAIKNMYDNQGFFYYQKRKYFTNKINYIRWNQAWMCYALSELILKQEKNGGDAY
jgi:uncharacterized protein YyaL (SSP411 family)